MWSIVAGILHFGNIRFNALHDEQASIASTDTFKSVCTLFGVPEEAFGKAILNLRVMAGRETVLRQQNVDQATFTVEALCKAVYERLFLWIVQRINEVLTKFSRENRSFVGILDIAGFEIFQINSFEQLCINFTNERLQQLFNHSTFVKQQEEYAQEGIDWKFIDFGMDLQPTIDLIGQRVFVSLDDQCSVPKATEQSFITELMKSVAGNSKIRLCDFRKPLCFQIDHYAGTVEYDTKDWLLKNRDPMNDAAVTVLAGSFNPLMKTMWTGATGEEIQERSVAARGRKGTFRTVGRVYKELLDHLMNTLNATSTSFVRCIIPNHTKSPGVFEGPLILEQLRCNGVMEGIRISCQGFPSKFFFSEFRQRYQFLAPQTKPSGFVDNLTVCQTIVKALSLTPDSFRIGKTKIFFRAGIVAQLEKQLDTRLSEMITQLQAHCRGFITRLRSSQLPSRRKIVDSARVIQRNIRVWRETRDWPWWRLFCSIQESSKQTPGTHISDTLLHSQTAELKQRAVALDEEITQLDARVPELQADVLSFQTKVDDQQSMLLTLEQKCDLLRSQIAEKERDAQRLAEESDAKAEKRDELQVLLHEMTVKVEALRTQLNTAQANSVSLKKKSRIES